MDVEQEAESIWCDDCKFDEPVESRRVLGRVKHWDEI